jgi:hypothetical protein
LRDESRISPTCFIQLSRSLDNKIAWWDDGVAVNALLYLTHYGVWTLKDQKNIKNSSGEPACSGLATYPFIEGESNYFNAPEIMDFDEHIQKVKTQQQRDGGNSKPMAIDVYQKHSHQIISPDDWRVIISNIEQNPDNALHNIKNALYHKNRVIFGLLVDPFLSDRGKNLGALGNYKGLKKDTWLITPQIKQDLEKKAYFASHSLIVIGYEDNACINNQCGLLRVRNSIGSEMGYHGDYFISYAYFKLLAMGKAIAIGPEYKPFSN